MAKAVLVTDMPEQVCQKCTLCYETENDDEYYYKVSKQRLDTEMAQMRLSDFIGGTV